MAKELKKSTPECRKDCDVYEDWQQLEAERTIVSRNAGLVMDNGKLQAKNKRLKEALEWIKEHHSCEFSCDDCDTPMMCSKKVAIEALTKGDTGGIFQ